MLGGDDDEEEVVEAVVHEEVLERVGLDDENDFIFEVGIFAAVRGALMPGSRV